MKNKSKKKKLQKGGAAETSTKEERVVTRVLKKGVGAAYTTDSTEDTMKWLTEEFTGKFANIFGGNFLQEKKDDEMPNWKNASLALVDEPCLNLSDFFSGTKRHKQMQNSWFHPELQVYYAKGCNNDNNLFSKNGNNEIIHSRKSYRDKKTTIVLGAPGKDLKGCNKYLYCTPRTMTSIIGTPFEPIKNAVKEAASAVDETAGHIVDEVDGDPEEGKECYPVLKSRYRDGTLSFKSIYCYLRILTFPFLQVTLLIAPVLAEFLKIIGTILGKIFRALFNSTIGLSGVRIPTTITVDKEYKDEEAEKTYFPWATEIIPIYFFSIIPGLNSLVASTQDPKSMLSDPQYWGKRLGDGKLGKFIIVGAVVSACIIGISGISIVMVLIAFASYCAKVIGLLTSNVED